MQLFNTYDEICIRQDFRTAFFYTVKFPYDETSVRQTSHREISHGENFLREIS